MKDGRWRTEAGGRRTVNPLADLWPLTSDLWLCAFAQQNGKPQRAKKDDRDNHVPRDVVPAIDGGNIFGRGDPDEKEGASEIRHQRKQNGADDEQTTLREREP